MYAAIVKRACREKSRLRYCVNLSGKVCREAGNHQKGYQQGTVVNDIIHGLLCKYCFLATKTGRVPTKAMARKSQTVGYRSEMVLSGGVYDSVSACRQRSVEARRLLTKSSDWKRRRWQCQHDACKSQDVDTLLPVAQDGLDERSIALWRRWASNSLLDGHEAVRRVCA